MDSAEHSQTTGGLPIGAEAVSGSGGAGAAPAATIAVPGAPVAFPHGPVKRRRRFVGVLVVLLVLVLVGSLGLNLALLALGGLGGLDERPKVREKHFSHQRFARSKVAILSIEGAILDGEGFLKRQIDHARRDIAAGRLKAIVVRVDSPGGTVSASDYVFHHLCELREETGVPIVVSMGGMAASGGYYVSMAVGDTPDSIYAEPTTWTGSIGVIIPHYDLSAMMENVGVREDSIASGPLKGMGSMTRAMTEAEREVFEKLIDEGFGRFKETIRHGRPALAQQPERLDGAATGQVFTARQALELGLVDRIGYLEAAVDRAIELAGVPPDEVSVVRYEREPGLLDLVIGAQASCAPAWSPAALAELAAPRAYYLCTTLPPLGGLSRP